MVIGRKRWGEMMSLLAATRQSDHDTGRWFFDSPLLDLVESLEHGHGDKDDDGLLSSLDVDLLGGGDGELLQLGLELGDVGLQVEDGLGDGLLDLIGGAGGGVGGTLNLGSVGGHFVL